VAPGNAILARSSQTLQEHVELMLRAYNSCYRTRGWHESTAARLELDPSLVDRLARITIAFHDVGKIFFQSSIRKCRGSPWHEVLSGLLLSHSMPEFDLRSVNDVGASVHIAVAYHHVAMRVPRQLLTSREDVRRAITSESLDAIALHEVRSALEHVVGERIALDGSVVESVKKEFSKGLKAYIDGLEGFATNAYTSVLSSRLLSVLIVTDNLSAASSSTSTALQLRPFLRDLPPYCKSAVL